MRRLLLLPQADRDIDDAADEYAEAGGLELGLRFLDATEQTWQTLREFPHSGRVYDWQDERLKGVRRWMVSSPFQVYLIFYRVTDDEVQVLRVLHGSRDIPSILVDESDSR